MKKFSGLAQEEYKTYWVEINPYCRLRTIEIGSPDKPTIVFIHGFGASGLMYWRIFKPLAHLYHIYTIDLPGMGASTRVPFLPRTAAETQEFFTSYVEEWRIAVGNITDFYLIGHSFGGYISGLYAHAYS